MKLYQLLMPTTCPETEARNYSALELYLNPGSPSGWSSHRKGISALYNPDFYSGNGSGQRRELQAPDFPFFLLDRQELDIFEAHPSPHLRRFFIQQAGTAKQFRVALHPDALKQLSIARPPDGMVQAYLTVATRTVLTAEGDTPIFLKFDYPGIIGRCPRRLGVAELHTSAFFSRTFDEWSKAGFFSKAFGYLPESLGLLWKFDPDQEAVGLIGREFLPRPFVKERRIRIPFFSLASRDRANPDEPSLLTQIVHLNSSASMTACDVFLQITGLIFQAIHSLFAWERTPDGGLTKYRLAHDCHAQNILLELDSKGMPCRIIFRDFQHMYPVVFDDSAGMEGLLDRNPFAKILDLRMEPDYVPRKLSQLVDHKLGEYVIHPLIDEFCAHFGSRRESLIDEIRKQFHSQLGELHALLPQDRWYRCSDGMGYDRRGRIRLVQGEGIPLLRE